MDIEGTVAPIEFVHQKMFPYVRDNVQSFLSTTWDSEQTQQDVQLLITQSEADVQNQVENIKLITGSLATTPKDELLQQCVGNVLSQMDIDRKIGALKTLQGHIWHAAFTSKALIAELYDDVYAALAQWSQGDDEEGKNKKTLAIYSSGSIGAQKLLFSHTKQGDLTPLFTGGFYDTGVGFKREKQSYINILTQFGLTEGDKPSTVLFLTDIYEESVAAKEAGMNTVLVIRPGNYPIPENHGFDTITSFLELK